MLCIGNCPGKSKKSLDLYDGHGLERREQMLGSLPRFNQDGLSYVWRTRVREKTLLMLIEMY